MFAQMADYLAQIARVVVRRWRFVSGKRGQSGNLNLLLEPLGYFFRHPTGLLGFVRIYPEQKPTNKKGRTVPDEKPSAPTESAPAKQVAPYCLATIVDPKGLAALLESARDAGTESSYTDSHPWKVAHRLLDRATALELSVPLLLAVEGALDASATLSHWALISGIEIVELSGKRYTSRIGFGALEPVPAIFEPLDSLFLKPPSEQLEREYLEGIRSHRQALSETYIRPYAVCETPGFIPGLADWDSVLQEL